MNDAPRQSSANSPSPPSNDDAGKIKFSCLHCKRKLKVKDAHAGRSIQCPVCKGSLKVPSPAEAAPTVSLELGLPRPQSPRQVPLPAPPALLALPAPAKPQAAPEPILDVLPADDDEHIQTSPRRSKRRKRDFDFDDEDDDEDRGFRCPYCRSRARPRYESKISAAGWVIFAVMLVFFWPLFWIGLLMKENYRVCRDCRATV